MSPPTTCWAFHEVLSQDQFLLLVTKNLDLYTISKKYLPIKNLFYGQITWLGLSMAITVVGHNSQSSCGNC